MLKTLRHKGVAKKIIWAVAIIIIISFGFMGTAYLLTGNTNTNAGKIFGKTITIEDFSKALQSVRVQAIIRYGDKFAEVRQYLNLEAEAWDRLILLHDANKRKIKIADETVIKTIQEYPFFLDNEQFDQTRYLDILEFVFRIQPRQFEESMRNTLKLQELYKEVTASIHPTEEEIHAAFKEQNEKIQISYALITPDQFKNEVTTTDEQLRAYYNDNKMEFLLPPSINASYIKIPFPTNEQGNVDPDVKNDIELKAHTIFQDLLVNPDIQAVAKQYELTSAETGFFSMEKPNLSLGWSYEFLNKLFKAEPEEILEPFQNDDAIYLVKAGEKQKSNIPEFENTIEKVRETVINKEAKVIARQKTEEYRANLLTEMEKTYLYDFAKSAKTLNLDINQTPLFKRGQYLPKIGISKEFQEAAFALSEGNKVSPVVETTSGFCILYLDKYEPADETEFKASKDAIAENLVAEKKNEIFTDYLTHLRVEANLQDNLSDLKKPAQ